MTEEKKGGGKKGEKTGDYSGHYVIASSRPPERRLLERRMLVPIVIFSDTLSSKRESLSILPQICENVKKKLKYFACFSTVQTTMIPLHKVCVTSK